MGSSLPNFFIVGTGKAGTTSLHDYLGQHPQIYMSPVKEPCYFSPEIRAEYLSEETQKHVAKQSLHLAGLLDDGQPVKPLGWLAADWNDYVRLFQNVAGETAIGEASAAYLWSGTAAGNIRSRIPEAKIVMILRDPAERAYSHYLHQLAVGLTDSTFREHIQECERQSGKELNIWYPFLEIGLYHEQVKRFFDAFPRNQIRIYEYEKDWRDPAGLLSGLFEFLNVDVNFRPDISRKSHERRAPRSAGIHRFLKRHGVWEQLKALVPLVFRPRLSSVVFRSDSLTIEPADRKYLVDYYSDVVRKLETLLNRDLSGWQAE